MHPFFRPGQNPSYVLSFAAQIFVAKKSSATRNIMFLLFSFSPWVGYWVLNQSHIDLVRPVIFLYSGKYVNCFCLFTLSSCVTSCTFCLSAGSAATCQSCLPVTKGRCNATHHPHPPSPGGTELLHRHPRPIARLI